MSHKAILKTASEDIQAILRRAVADEKRQLGELRDMYEENKEKMASLASQASRLEKEARSLYLKLVPVYGALMAKSRKEKLEVLHQEKKQLAQEAKIIERGARQCIQSVRSLEVAYKQVRRAERVISLLQHNGNRFDEIVALGNRAEFHKRAVRDDRATAAFELAKEFHRIVSTLYRYNSQRNQKATAPSVIRPSEKGLDAQELEQAAEHRIYLPVSRDELRLAVRKGATGIYQGGELVDAYITLDQDRAPFEGYLPHLYREKRKPLAFPPIAMNARGQNIHGIFTRDTWSRIRQKNYRHTNGRCSICGRTRGFFLDNVWPEEVRRRRRSGVDCHEIWEWEEKDAFTGIQKLADLIVVCVDCHMMFHEDYAVDVAVRAGYREEDIREFIEKRRLLATHLSEHELRAQVSQEAVEHAQRARVENWIIDLSHLGNQTYMNFNPVLDVEDTHISPDMIAGIGFETTEGTMHEAREAEEIYRSFGYDQRRAAGFGR